jgi:predicted house-cleaning noncanonical NTP pyrophosphatase (MazG superfamily)
MGSYTVEEIMDVIDNSNRQITPHSAMQNEIKELKHTLKLTIAEHQRDDKNRLYEIMVLKSNIIYLMKVKNEALEGLKMARDKLAEGYSEDGYQPNDPAGILDKLIKELEKVK